MATTQTEQIYLKLGIDTTQFNSSIKGTQQEIRGLKSAVGNNLLTPEEQQAVLKRMQSLKDSIGDIGQAINKVEGFELVNRSVGAFASGLGAAAGALKLFGVENQKLNKVMEVSMVVMQASLALQGLKDLANLKSIAIITAQSVATGIATAAQWAWNAAMAANPIGALVVAIAALIAGITLLVRWLSSSTDEVDKQNKLVTEYLKTLKSWTDEIDDVISANQRLVDELAVMNDEMTQSDADRAKARQDHLDAMNKLDDKYEEELKKLNEDEKKSHKEKLLLKQTLDEVYAKNKTALEQNLNLTIQKIDKQEVIDNKKTQEEKTKNLQDELKKRLEAEQRFRAEIARDELELKKLLDSFKNEEVEETLSDKFIGDSQKAFEDFSASIDIAMAGLAGSAKQALDKTIASGVGILNVGNYEEYLKLLTDLRIEYTDNLEKLTTENAQKMIVQAGVERDQNIANLKTETLLEEEEIKKRHKNGELTQAQYNDKIALLQKEFNAKYQIEIAKNAKEVEDINAKLAKDLEKIRKDSNDKNIEYNKEALNDIIKFHQSAIEGVDQLLATENRRSKEYQNILANRNFHINKQIEALQELKKITEEEINLRIDLTSEQKLRQTTIATQELDKEINKLYYTLNNPPHKPLLKEQISDLEALNIAMQAAGDLVNQFLAASMDKFNQSMDEKFQALSDMYEKDKDKLQEIYDKRLISEELYNRKVQRLDEEKAKKEKALKQEQWRKEHEAAIIQATINTALAVTAALTQLPPASYVMAALNAALGAVQIGLIASQEMPKFAKGGFVNYQTGGMLSGPSHSQGGIPVMAEGGEFIIQKSIAQQPGMNQFLNNINSGQPTTVSLNTDDLRTIVREVASIPVTNVETEYTRVQRKVQSIETSATF